MTRGATRESVSGVVIRVSTEPKTAPRGGYLFRGLEISGNMGNDRIFVIFPAFLGRDLYEFPLLCWEGAQVAAFDVELNNRLRDGTVIYHATQESEVLLEPHRPVSITDAVQAVECIRSVDVRFRVGSGEPFWMAKGKLVHTLFDHLVHDRGTSPERMFEEAFRLALTALKEILPGSRVSFTEEQLESQARDHFNNLLSWWAEMRDRTLHTEVEVDRISSRWGLKGRADAVLHAKDRTAIVELKTGRVALEGHMLQLLAYSLLFSKDEGDTLPEAYLFYSANGKAEKLDSTRAYPRRAILEGRNLVVALKRSYSFPKDPVPEPLAIGPCGQRGRCLFKRDCYRLFGSSQGRRPILVGREREYYDRWFGLLSRDIWSVEEELARILNSATLSQRVEEGITFPVAELITESRPDAAMSQVGAGGGTDTWDSAVDPSSPMGADIGRDRPRLQLVTTLPLPRPVKGEVAETLSPGGRGQGEGEVEPTPSGPVVMSVGHSPSHSISYSHERTVVMARFSSAGHTTDFGPGEELLLHRGDPCAQDAYRARVVGSDEEYVYMSIPVPAERGSELGPSSQEALSRSEGWFVDRQPFVKAREVAREALFEFLTAAQTGVARVVVHGEKDANNNDEEVSADEEPQDERLTDRNREPMIQAGRVAVTGGTADAQEDVEDLCFSEGLSAELNEEQETAVMEALGSETYHLIHGPPGTGKTRVLARLIRLCLDRGERVLVTCPTNVALDGLLLAVMDLGMKDFIRVGRRSTVSERFLSALDRIGSPPALLGDLARMPMDFRSFKHEVLHTPLVGATAYQCAAHPFFTGQKFDRVIVDEAGQLDEPSILAPLTLCKRFVLGGDHLQLPPVVQTRRIRAGSHDEALLEQSLFERLFRTSPARSISRLRMQYRMNQEVQDVPSRVFYDGELYPCPDAKTRRLRITPGASGAPEIDRIIDPDLPVVFVDVEGADSGKARPEEAEVACKIVEGLVACGVPSNEVGIITPYRAQQSLIRKRLSRNGNSFPLLTVDTVDRFQGGEREVIILSLSRSDEVTSFLADRKRLNVSLSRARSKLILLGHGPVLEGHPLFAAILEGLERIKIGRKT